MDSSNSWFSNLLLKIKSVSQKFRGLPQRLKGTDNFLTTETYVAGVAVLIVAIVIGVLLVTPAFNKKPNRLAIAPTPTPTPTPIPLPRGPREFGVSGGDNPSITNLKFSEYNPKVGEKQTITISIMDGKGKVLGVEIALITDHKTKTYPLTLTSGTTKKGEWSTTIISDDTSNYVYGMVIKAKSDKGPTSIVEPRFR